MQLPHRHLSRAEGLAGLADVEFKYVFGEGGGADEGAGELGMFGKGGGEEPGDGHADIVGGGSLRGALLGEVGLAFFVAVGGVDARKVEGVDYGKDFGEPLLGQEVGHGDNDGEAHFKFAGGAEIGLQERPKFGFICSRHPLGVGTIGIAHRPVVEHGDILLKQGEALGKAALLKVDKVAPHDGFFVTKGGAGHCLKTAYHRCPTLTLSARAIRLFHHPTRARELFCHLFHFWSMEPQDTA